MTALIACARTLPPAPSVPEVERRAAAPSPEPATREAVVAPALSAEQLIEDAGLSTFLEDRALSVAVIDGDAVERWFTRPPRALFVYTERSVEIPSERSRRARCERMPRWANSVMNALAVVLSREGPSRTVLDLGQEGVSVLEQQLEGGRWHTVGVRRVPVAAVAWNDDHIRYAEGAEIFEVACVPVLRTVSCGEGRPGRGHCVDDAPVVRPWRAPMVPHVGAVIAAYDDPIPAIPEGDCSVECERSACEDARGAVAIPRARLFTEDSPVLAAFRSRAACRAYASARDAARDEGEAERPW